MSRVRIARQSGTKDKISKVDTRILKANAILFLAAVLFGSVFVAQRIAMDHLGPFSYTGLRFALGAFCLAPIAWHRSRRWSGRACSHKEETRAKFSGRWPPVWASLVSGGLMCLTINLQQIGLVHTTAGKAGFITGLYIIIVPLLRLFIGKRPGLGLWAGASLGATGLYFLSVSESFSLAPGDGWVLGCAFAAAGHVIVIGWLAPKMDSFVLAFGQTLVNALVSLTLALFLEDISLNAIIQAGWVIIYGGVVSAGIAFTLQVIGQKNAPPAHAAVILSFESVMAAVSGWIVLNEDMSPRSMFGAFLMLSGMLTAQFTRKRG